MNDGDNDHGDDVVVDVDHLREDIRKRNFFLILGSFHLVIN